MNLFLQHNHSQLIAMNWGTLITISAFTGLSWANLLPEALRMPYGHFYAIVESGLAK